MKSLVVIIGLLLVAFVVGYVVFSGKERSVNTVGSQVPVSSVELKDLGEIPDLTLSDYNGQQQSLRSFAKPGKITIYNSWASWCPFCVEELPAFSELQSEYGDDIQVIAINRRESLEQSKSYTDQQGTTGELTFLLDPSDSFYREIGGFTMPETLFVDENGVVRIHKRGDMKLPEMRTFVEALLES